MPIIYDPPVDGQVVYLQSDYRYASHDPMLWPQHYTQEFCHLGSIPLRPSDPKSELQILWYEFQDGDFQSTFSGFVAGVGHPSSALIKSFQPVIDSISNRFAKYMQDKDYPHKNHLLRGCLARAIGWSEKRGNT